ncbi:MAG: hypothetical protein HRU20_18700 [Pseudomonadales bacterium]|nr:hypothetical protein [Pseudomonadales bacterium]
MDMAWMHKAFAILKQQTEKGIGIIAVVHDLNLASLYADQIVLLDQQQVLHCGPPVNVITKANIEQVFKTQVSIIDHPQNKKPVVIQAAL